MRSLASIGKGWIRLNGSLNNKVKQMDKDVSNVITVANMFEIVSGTMRKVGYEYVAPLSEAEEQEVISRQINKALLEDK